MEVKALESLMKSGNGKLPINVKVIFEGEEEVGGESIAEYVRKQKAKLKADFALVCDTELFAPNLPTLCVGLRGLVYTEIEAVGAMTDLHSGVYGGAAPNPFFALIEIISKLKDSKGKVLIPGFYKGVKAPSKDELKAWKRLPFNEEHYRKTEVGSKVLTGEPGYSVLYRTWARPTLEVHGMPGGFIAAGAKTVIPAKAAAKVSMRLVPNQDPDKMANLFEAYVRKAAPKTVELKFTRMHGGKPWMTEFDNKYVQAAGRAIKQGFGQDPVFNREGGSIPVVATFQEILGLPEIRARWNIQKPEQVIDVLALMGDSTDNVPGVPGIGEKTAMKLIGQFGSVENLLSRTGEVTGKLKENLEKNRDVALLSKRLVTILCDTPCDYELDTLKVQTPDEDKVKALLSEFEFNSIGRRLFGEDFKAGRGFQPAKAEPKTVTATPQAEELVLIGETMTESEEASSLASNR